MSAIVTIGKVIDLATRLFGEVRALLERGQPERGSPFTEPHSPPAEPAPPPGIVRCSSCGTDQQPGRVHYPSLAGQRPCPASWSTSKAAR